MDVKGYITIFVKEENGHRYFSGSLTDKVYDLSGQELKRLNFPVLVQTSKVLNEITSQMQVGYAYWCDVRGFIALTEVLDRGNDKITKLKLMLTSLQILKSTPCNRKLPFEEFESLI